MVNANELREILASRHEWRLIRGTGRSFPLLHHELEVIEDAEKVHFGFLDESGFHSWRLNGFRTDANEIEIDVAGSFGNNRETLWLIPRIPAAELSAEIEIARLKRANEIAGLIPQTFPAARLVRVAVHEPGGRLAQVVFDREDRTPYAAIADVTNAITVESLFTAAMLWLEKLGERKKKTILNLWLVCEKRPARNARKLLALLSDRWKANSRSSRSTKKAIPPS